MTDYTQFDAWKAKVDELVIAETGLSCDDWPDWCYADDFEEGIPPAITAMEMLEDQGFDSFSTEALDDAFRDTYG